MNPAQRTTSEEWEEWPGQWIVRADLARELETQLTDLRDLWSQFISIMEIVEESDSGHKFCPNRITSCRVVDGERIQKILDEAKQLINANVN